MSEKAKIQSVLNEWFSMGYDEGSWGGYFHYMSDEITEVEDSYGDVSYHVYVDFGSSYREDAIRYLSEMLENAGCMASWVNENGGELKIY